MSSVSTAAAFTADPAFGSRQRRLDGIELPTRGTRNASPCGHSGWRCERTAAVAVLHRPVDSGRRTGCRSSRGAGAGRGRLPAPSPLRELVHVRVTRGLRVDGARRVEKSCSEFTQSCATGCGAGGPGRDLHETVLSISLLAALPLACAPATALAANGGTAPNGPCVTVSGTVVSVNTARRNSSRRVRAPLYRRATTARL